MQNIMSSPSSSSSSNSSSSMEEDRFFDTHDEIETESCSGVENSALRYEFWTKNPESINERRTRFLKWMNNEVEDRLEDKNDAELANLDSEDQFFSSRSSYSNEDLEMEEEFKIKNLDDGTEFIIDEMLSKLRQVGSNRTVSFDDFGSSPMVQRFLRRNSEDFTVHEKKKVKKSWLARLSGVSSKFDKSKGLKTEKGKVKVRVQSKHSKELSSVYIGQDFRAHKGSISTMKFSPDGQYLASAGKDGIIRVWKVIEDENSNSISNKFNVQEMDLFFSLNDSSKITPLGFENETKKVRYSSESACVILPSNIFRLLEKPVHEFCGHLGEVLALSWSKNGYLLSSSVDKTARLWKVGSDQCLKVYAHNNYVTCIEFNPMDENYFISGSIDGKVRMWEVHNCRVVDWTDLKEIVSAVCFRPDGKGGIVGSMDGNCHFYEIIDNRLELGAQTSLPGKKLTGKRITGFQFCPNDSRKVMVTSADSQVRILSGSNLICKYKGIRYSGSQAPASFTQDGKHIISATEDSKVIIWNYINQDRISSQVKNISSCETFSSHNASIAIPWCGLNPDSNIFPDKIILNNENDNTVKSKPDCFALSHRFFLDSLYKGTATWPEEKLVNSNVLSSISPSICKSELKFLKSALQSAFTNPHLWGHVIVTAGWDGCIRTFLNHGLPIRF